MAMRFQNSIDVKKDKILFKLVINPRMLIKVIFQALLDSFFCWLSWIGAVFVFSYLFVLDHALLSTIQRLWWIFPPICILFFMVCGVYKAMWHHPSVGTMIRISAAVFLCSFAIYVALRVDLGYWSNPGLGVIAFYFLLTLSATPRLAGRVYKEVIKYFKRYAILQKTLPDEPIHTLIIGAGESAAQFLQHPNQQGARPRKIVGILDNDVRKQGYFLHGVPVIGNDSQIPVLVRDKDVSEIIIAIPTMKNEDLRRIVRLTPIQRCKVRMLTGLSNGKTFDALRDLNIADLLRRPEASLNKTTLNEWLKDKTVLVTGGGGSIGSELCRQLIQLDVRMIVIYDIYENNAYDLMNELVVNFGQLVHNKVAIRIGSVQDESRLNVVFEEFKPSIVFHAAAYKHVPLMEDYPRLALDNNVIGTYRTALCAIRHKVERFVMISTDKAVNPTNVMGASKRMAEMLTLGFCQTPDVSTEFVCVRFGNVLNSNGSVIPLFKRQIEAGGPITVTHPDIIRYFMTIAEAAKLVLEAGEMANGGELFILDMGEQVKIVDLAENLIRMAGLTPGVDIKIVFTGLRPGEKLYEELLLDADGLDTTHNDKIYMTRPKASSSLKILYNSLAAGLPDGNDPVALLKQFVPEYVPMA